MSNGMSRRKGKGGELEVCARLKPFWPNASRELNQPQGSPLAGRDLKNTSPFCIQVKRDKRRPAVEARLKQAADAVTFDYSVPVLMARGNEGEWLAVMYLADWLCVVRK